MVAVGGRRRSVRGRGRARSRTFAVYGDVLGAQLLILDSAWVTNLGNGERVWADVATDPEKDPLLRDPRAVSPELKLELQPDTWKIPLKPGKYHSALFPTIAQRNPSITPTTGLREYSSRHFSGTILLEKPTGDIYRPICTMKGTT